MDLPVTGRAYFGKKGGGGSNHLTFQNGTLPATNIAPENWWLEDVFPIGNAYFQGANC